MPKLKLYTLGVVVDPMKEYMEELGARNPDEPNCASVSTVGVIDLGSVNRWRVVQHATSQG